MRRKEILVGMNIGETKAFPREHSASLRSTVSRLKRDCGLPFHCTTTAEGCFVTRLPVDCYKADVTEEILQRSGFHRSDSSWRNWEWLSDDVRVSVDVKRKRFVFNVRREDGLRDRGSVRVVTVGELQNYFELLGIDIYLKI